MDKEGAERQELLLRGGRPGPKEINQSTNQITQIFFKDLETKDQSPGFFHVLQRAPCASRTACSSKHSLTKSLGSVLEDLAASKRGNTTGMGQRQRMIDND